MDKAEDDEEEEGVQPRQKDEEEEVRVHGSRFRVQSAGFRVQGSGSRVQVSVFGVSEGRGGGVGPLPASYSALPYSTQTVTPATRFLASGSLPFT